jgi:excisionase family DNA binding protein
VTLPDLNALVRDVPAEELPALVGRLREAELLAEVRLRSVPTQATTTTMADENLSADEAARRLGVSKEWVYKNAKGKKLPFTVTIGRRVLFSARGLERWSQQRMGR